MRLGQQGPRKEAGGEPRMALAGVMIASLVSSARWRLAAYRSISAENRVQARRQNLRRVSSISVWQCRRAGIAR